MGISSLLPEKKKTATQEDLEILAERASELHRESTVIDGHAGTLFDIVHNLRDFGEESDTGHVDLPRLKRGGVHCVFLSAFITDRLWPIRGVRAGLEYADAFNRLAETRGIRAVKSTRDIEEAKSAGEIAVLLSFEGGEFLEGSLEALRMFYRLGLRMLTLTWNDRNLLADGAAVSKSRGGLTPLGLEVVREAGRLGIIVDVSHISEAGFWDLAEMGELPIVASHSNCHRLLAHPRNLTDDQLKAVAATGGVVGISFNPEYLVVPGEEATMSKVADHICHAVEVAGEEYVAIGSDFDSFSEKGPQPLCDISKLPLLTEELLRRGMPGKTITGILGGNWLRVLRAVIG
ncbi:MAG TPA: membrane dipeptidase [Firmicutes bacterium]|nr:membrane dipeptidase [Candidatus Fermentithermobacillaceae bacterium]